MPPQLAALLCIAFILALFWWDRKKGEDVSAALWIPLIWMFFAGSRYLSQWLNLGSPLEATEAYIEGSPADRLVFAGLIVAGVIVLFRRRIAWGRWLASNPWIWLFFLFGAVSILWSAYPDVSFKRLIKATGNVIMALVVLTEKRPNEAVGVVLRRLAYMTVPLSVLFIKYIPDLGRSYHRWTYEPMYTGVAMQKNGLGQICLLAGIYFLWVLLVGRHDRTRLGGRLNVLLYLTMMLMIAWLMDKADSATSLACLILVAGILVVSRLPPLVRNPRRILTLGLTAVLLFGALEVFFDLSDSIIGLLGRDPTLTTRTDIWGGLLTMAGNPLLGVGYESFWLGERMQAVWEEYKGIKQAHNGYLELYLNLGLIGVGIMVAAILAGLVKVRRALGLDYPAAMLRLCFIVTVVMYNYAEATFYGVSNMWTLLYLGIMDAPGERERFGAALRPSAIRNHKERAGLQTAGVDVGRCGGRLEEKTLKGRRPTGTRR